MLSRVRSLSLLAVFSLLVVACGPSGGDGDGSPPGDAGSSQAGGKTGGGQAGAAQGSNGPGGSPSWPAAGSSGQGGSGQAGSGQGGSGAGQGGSSAGGGAAGGAGQGGGGSGGSAGAPSDPCAGASDGPHCGQSLPLGIADSIYTCQAGLTASRVGCALGCDSSQSPPACKASDDPCLKAPAASGSFCGSRMEAPDSDSLYTCAGHATVGKTGCPDGCKTSAAGDACAQAPVDPCATAELGNGAYCGASLGKPNDQTLYTCKDKQAVAKQACPDGCQVMPPGDNDACKTASGSDPCEGATQGDAAYCGSGLPGGDPSTLYACKDKKTAGSIKCSAGCQANPPGVVDACMPTGGGGFGFPTGDKTSYPAGGWVVSQALGHYLDSGQFKGIHMAEDIAHASGEGATANAPIYSVGDGVVRYAGGNKSTYVNVVLIEHQVGNGEVVCSFYGHLNKPSVTTGQAVQRGQQIATVLDWNASFGWDNSHLHYVLVNKELCDASTKASGAMVCGYDNAAPFGVQTYTDSPAVYQPKNDICGDHQFTNPFITPSAFILSHHF